MKVPPDPPEPVPTLQLDIDVQLEYQLCTNETVLLILEAAATDAQSIRMSQLEIDEVRLHRIEGAHNIGHRLWALGPPEQLLLRYRATVDVRRAPVVLECLAMPPLPDLPAEVLTYLRPSRFCQSDLFTNFTAQQFGNVAGGAKIAAMLDWISANIDYVPGSSNATTTATDTFAALTGVCRDFAHLLCSLARASGIPARYVSAYGADVQPPDFHAAAEVWLDGAWHIVDPTGMEAAENLALIAVGRDAADVAFMETKNWAQQIRQSVTVKKNTRN